MLGGGIVGTNAAQIAMGIGARVIIMDPPSTLALMDQTVPYATKLAEHGLATLNQQTH
jgi:alanine dehydrogenase